MRRVSRRGQSLVEAALVLPLLIFLFLGTVQLFLMLQGRLFAQHAAFKAVRSGVVTGARCRSMEHAAIVALMPSLHTYVQGSPAADLAAAFRTRISNQYNARDDAGLNGPIVWIHKEPLAATSESFDRPQPDTGAPLDHQLRATVVYWFPMKIPFANWVISTMYRAYAGLQSYQTEVDPIMPNRPANWQQEVTPTIDAAVSAEWSSRIAAQQYVFPITATYSMRMMTPTLDNTSDCRGGP